MSFHVPIFNRMRVEEAVERLEGIDVALFSAYVWNARISSEIARLLKKKKPETVVLFGGPQVPNHAEAFLRSNPFIAVMHGEGERMTSELLTHIDSPKWRETPGISFLGEDGGFRHNLTGERIKDINVIPSPYLSGAFEQVMKENPNQKWIALWETNRGCPFSCTYCDWGSATQSKVSQFAMDRLLREVDWFAEKEIEFIFCCDANYGMLNRDLDITEYVAEVKGKTGFPRALSVQNTKNATERAYKVQKTLSDAGLNKGVTLAIQSMDQQTLKNIKRQNISLESYHELQRRFTRDRVETYSDYILALPGETYDATVEGVTTLIENGQHNRIQFNNLSVLPNAEMGNPEYLKKFGMVTVENNIINIHGSLEDADNDILEKQQMVVATAAMPLEDWVHVRSFCWLTALLHFDKVLQIPLMVTRTVADLRYRTLFEGFSLVNPSRFRSSAGSTSSSRRGARSIQAGGPEFHLSREYLNIFWPHDEYILIELIASGRIDAFYDEAERFLLELAGDDAKVLQPILADAVKLNRSLLKRPFQTEDLEIELRYNIPEHYNALRMGESAPLIERPTRYYIDRTSQVWNTWDDYCREVIWYGNKKGAYLYTNRIIEPQIAGIY